MGGYYLEDLYKADPDHPIRQALSTRHNFRVIIEKLNATMAVVNNLVIRNNIVYTYVESVDSTHPFEIDFHIPTATDTIKKISLTLRGLRFRAYSSTIPSGGGSTSGSGGGQTTSASGSYTGGILSLSLSAHNGGYLVNTYTSINATDVDHVHTVANHTHSTPNHVHSLTFGIYEGTTPTAVNGYYDNGAGYSVADSYGNAPDTTTPWNIKTEYNVTSKYSGTGWKRLKLDTSRLGRFNIILMIEVDLTPTT
jgi:hypothetical protein